jgi:transposase
MRYELADYEWAAIKPMLPNKPRGVPRVNDRRVLNGIFWVLRSGAPGVTCRRRLAHTRLATTVSSAGDGPVSGAASLTHLPLCQSAFKFGSDAYSMIVFVFMARQSA